jgi:hypothetical protein
MISHSDLNDSVRDLTPDELNQTVGGWLGWEGAESYWKCLQNNSVGECRYAFSIVPNP